MLMITFIGILLLAGILSGIYLSLRHILGYEFAWFHRHGSSIGVFLLRVGIFMFFYLYFFSGLMLTIGVGVYFAFLNLLILKRMKMLQRVKRGVQRLVFSGSIAGSIAMSVASIGVAFINREFDIVNSQMGIMSIIGGGIIGALSNGAVLFTQFVGTHLSRLAFHVIAPLFVLLRFATIICNHCYRVTVPLKSRYELGRRHCEHCHQEVEDTRDPGKVIFTFGEVPLTPEGRVFVLANPDFEDKEHYVEVSEVYLDPNMTDKRLFERFITYIVNYPPTHGIQSVKIFYQEQLDDLGPNLKNALQNIFERVEQFS